MRKMSRRARQTPEEPAASESRMALDRLFRVPGEGPWGAVAAAVATAGGERLWASPEGSGRFDLASLTKPFVATLALVLDRTGRLPLGLRVGSLLPEAVPPLARRSLAALLRHRAGLRAWAPLPRLVRHRDAVVRLLAGPRFQGAPPGTYSDLGYILWGLAAERALGEPLAALLARELLAPLGLADRVGPSPGARVNVVSMPLDNRRERELARALGIGLGRRPAPGRGEVQDGNARWLGGCAGHAGLFGDLESLLVLGQEWLAPQRVLTPELVRRALAGGGPYALGWARRRVRGSAGAALPATAFGHTGFTGGSLWLDPERRLLLAIAGHRRALEPDLNPWRRRFHALGIALADAARGSSPAAG